jgi:hypothetical protein
MKGNRTVSVLVFVCTVFSASSARADDERPAPISAAQYAADRATPPKFTATPEYHHDTLPSLRHAHVPRGDRGERINFEGQLPLPPGADSQTDGAVQSTVRAPSAATPAPIDSVDGVGLGFSGPQGTFVNRWIPPDTVGAIGSTQYVQAVNDNIAVFDKATKSVVYGPVPENILWAGFGGGCETNNDGDPVVAYDKAADRWVVSQFSVSTTPFLQCVAVSQTNDATGAWNRYAFTYTDFPDYPKMGVWPDAYYITFNMFKPHGNKFDGAALCAYDRAAMLAGSAATQQCFQLAASFGGVLPADLDGSTPPPAGSPNYLLNFGTNSLNLWKFHVDWANTANTTLTGPTSIPVASFSPACAGGSCIPQSGTTQKLDSLADRLMFRLAYRNFGSNESLVVSHSVTAGAGAGVRWYEIRNPGATPVVYQQSTYAPGSTLYRWMPSIAMDHSGDIALGYSTSGSSAFPSVVYTGRLAADPLSTMGAEVTMMAGTGAQSASRWGDYSAMTIDPVDDCTFWYTTEYMSAAANATTKWSTRIGSFKFPECIAGAAFTVTPSVSGSGSIAPSTAQLVASGTSPTFTIAPSTGSHIVGVSGNCGGNLASQVFTTNPIVADCSVIANFAVDTFTLTYTTDGNGTIVGPATQSNVAYGTDGAQVTAIANAGYNFDHWSDNNSTSATRQDLNVTGDITAQAVFVPETQLVFTINPSTVTAGGSTTMAEVSIEDASSRVVPSDSTTQISIVDGLCGTTLASAIVNAGVAQFNNLAFRTASSNLHLHAISNPVLTSADSAAFNVQANPDWLFWNGFETCVP